MRDNAEGLQWCIAKRAMRLGVDVLIEWGTWARCARDALREDARDLGARIAVYDLTAARATIRSRARRYSRRSRSAFQ